MKAKQFLFSLHSDLQNWITSVLTNDENSTDNELIKYFIIEGKFSKKEAETLVSLRNEFINKI